MTGVPQIEVETVNEEDVSRRSFLQTGGACLAGGLLLPQILNKQLAVQLLADNHGLRWRSVGSD